MPALIGSQLIPWKRYWVPWNGQVHSGWDGTGFITEPGGSFGRAFNPHLRSIEEILDRPLLVLSGQPGIGKTQAIEQLKAKWTTLGLAEELIHLEARVLSDLASVCRATVDEPLWRKTLSDNGKIRLLVDGVDEATMRRIDLLGALTHVLKNQPLERIRVILVSRAAEWDAEQGKRFAQLWKSDTPKNTQSLQPDKKVNGKPQPNLETETVWELCHLCQIDAQMAAEACSVDPKQFLRDVRELHVEGLAARPMTLKMLLEEYKANPKFDLTFHELYQRSILRMCGEVNEERGKFVGPYPPQKQVYRTAARIAACLLFGRKSVIVKSPASSENPAIELSCDKIVGEEVEGTAAFNVTHELIGFTLDTQLFSFRGPNYGFDQKTYAEFLAANYVANCSLDQLKSLFCIRLQDREIIAPHLAEVAAWVAIQNKEWCRHVAANDPEVLLRADVSAMADDLKALALSNYLQKAAHEEAFDHQGLDKFYATFNHPCLAAQLRPYIVDSSQNMVVRRIAIRIAGDCHLSALEKELWKRAKVRDTCINYVASALGRITGLHAIRNLMAILKGKFPPENYRELNGMAIRVLVPKKMTVRKVLPYLKTGPKKEAIDSYHIAVNYHLHEYLEPDDLVPALEWLKDIPGVFDALHALNQFSTKVFAQALCNWDDRKIRHSAVALWIHCVNTHQPHPSPVDRYDDRLPKDYGLEVRDWKRLLAAALINSGAISEQQDQMLLYDLIQVEDFEWMLLELQGADKSKRAAWAKVCAAHINAQNASKHSDLVLKSYAAYPEFRAVLPSLGLSKNIVETLNFHYQSWLEGYEQHKKELETQRQRHPRREEMIETLLKNAKPKHHEWMDVSQWLWAIDPDDKRETATRDHSDVISSPGWKFASLKLRKQMKDSSRHFLLENHDTKRLPGHFNNGSRSAYLAIRLHFSSFKRDKKLAASVRNQWSSAIFNPFWSDNTDHAKILKWCYKLEPDLGASALIDKMRAEDKSGLPDLVMEPYHPCWDDRIRRRISKLVLTGKFKSRSTFRIHSWLVRNDPKTAHEIIQALETRTGFAPRNESDRALILSAWILLRDRYWQQLFRSIENMDSDEARSMFFVSSYELVHGDHPVFSTFEEAQLADFGILLFQLFPSDKYPGYRQSGDVKPEDHIADLRRMILNLLATKGSSQASAVILRIAESAKPLDRLWIKWQYNEALRSAAAGLVPARRPEEITALVRSSNAALVDSEDNLVSVILQSLNRLQAQLHAKSSEWRALWNEDGHRVVKKRRHPSGLEPKEEAALSDVVAKWLERDLGGPNRVVFNREVEISKGNFTDIKIDAFTKGRGNKITVIVESKRCIHPNVKTAAKSQLADQYLVPHGLIRGIYLVGWYRGMWQPPKGTVWRPVSLDAAKADLKIWTESASSGQIRIIPYLLDCAG